MEPESINGVRWISYVVPFKNPYTQAQILLQDFMVAGQYVLIAAWNDPHAAAYLHRAMDAFVQREFRFLRSPAWLPAGVLTLTNSHLCVKENYMCPNERGARVDICHVNVEANPKTQALQLLQSGIASNRYVLVRAIEASKRNKDLRESLIDHLIEGASNRFTGHSRIICPPPRGIITYTGRCLRCECVFNNTHSTFDS